MPKHKLLVMDMWFKATKSWRRKFEPRVHVWKLKEEKTCEEYRCIIGDKVQEANWKGLGINDRWQQMKGIMMKTAQDTFSFHSFSLLISSSSVSAITAKSSAYSSSHGRATQRSMQTQGNMVVE